MPNWNQGSIEDPIQPQGGRSLPEYEALLGMDRIELAGKNVLDLGAGPEAKFATEVAQAGIKANIVNLSPDYSLKKYADKLPKVNGSVGSVAGLGQHLPFPDNSFDIILASHLLDHINEEETYFSILIELSRVLASGGKAILSPVPMDFFLDNYFLNSALENTRLMTILKKANVQLSDEPLPEDLFETRVTDSLGYQKKWVGGFRLILKKE